MRFPLRHEKYDIREKKSWILCLRESMTSDPEKAEKYRRSKECRVEYLILWGLTQESL